MGSGPQVVDWNSDGRRDLVAGDRDGYFSTFIQGTSQLTAYYRMRLQNGETLDVGTNSMPQVVDWNSDGRKDVLVGNEEGYIRCYLNVGTSSSPVFQGFSYIYAGSSPMYLYRMHPYVVDLDRDGKRDLVCGSDDGCLRFFRNVGTDASPLFSTQESLRTRSGTLIRPGTYHYGSRAAFADWNNDGALDFVISGFDGWVELYLGIVGPVNDVGVSRIVAPANSVDSGAAVTPSCSVDNYGTTTVSYSVRMKIGSSYSQTASVTSHAPGTRRYVTFAVWNATRLGSYPVTCSTRLTGDMDRTNDPKTGSVTVSSIQGWQSMAALPLTPSGAPVKDGGWLVYNSGDGLVYAAKGNKTSDCYAFDRQEGAWRELRPVPSGREEKLASKGAAGCSDGNNIYATKGNNTQGFWKYDVALDSWKQLADVPLGTSNKKVKGGTDVAFSGASVYLLKGYRDEFWKYDVANDSWISLPSAPSGSSGKNKYDKGSWLVHDGDRRIFCHKAKYNELFVFDIVGDTWLAQLSGMPMAGASGKSKKSKDGGSAALLDGLVYALKGNNTQEFWRYDPAADTWHELDTLPQLGSGTKNRKVKAGGDITASTGALYALKGNKTSEFWRYVPYALSSTPNAPRSTQEAGKLSVSSLQLSVTPNPTRSGFVTVSAPGLKRSSGPVTVSIYDASGRLLQSSPCSLLSEISVDLRFLSAGIYVIRLESPGIRCTKRILLLD